MAAQHKDDVHSQDSSETNVVHDEKIEASSELKGNNADDEYDNLNYPPAWKFEKYFVGGYGQKRMIKFKKPKSMYTAINLFAGKTWWL